MLKYILGTGAVAAVSIVIYAAGEREALRKVGDILDDHNDPASKIWRIRYVVREGVPS